MKTKNEICECPTRGELQEGMASWYDKEKELPFVNHETNKCKCTNDIKLYERNGKKLWLCSNCVIGYSDKPCKKFKPQSQSPSETPHKIQGSKSISGILSGDTQSQKSSRADKPFVTTDTETANEVARESLKVIHNQQENDRTNYSSHSDTLRGSLSEKIIKPELDEGTQFTPYLYTENVRSAVKKLKDFINKELRTNSQKRYGICDYCGELIKNEIDEIFGEDLK
jgi:RNA polymerase-binding transcription factor DksA